MELTRTFYAETDLDDNSGEIRKQYHLQYYLLQKEIMLEGIGFCTYGIEIVLFERNGKENANPEYSKVYDAFCTRKDAEEVLDSLVRNKVTPVHLMEVLQDTVGVGDLVNRETSIQAIS